ncbi:MAG: tyrosine-type recombinase/integrase [Clostridia bacterium]|nr:tyrosine-type recombinase/integrase [Clostridia bacterium]
MNIRMEELPAAVARFLSYKLSIQGASEKTVYEYSIDLAGFLRYVFRKKADEAGNLDLSLITDEEIASISSQNIYEYLLYAATVLRNGNAARARKLCAIRGFFKFLSSKEHAIENSPAKDIDAPGVKHALPKFLSLEESQMLLRAAKEHGEENAKRDYAILTLFLNCGMRVSELAGISLSDLSTDLSQLIVTGKGNKQRLIYLNEGCVSALKEYIALRRGITCKDESALFVSRNHRRLSVKTVQWIVYKYLKLAGLEEKGYSVHKLRHTAATLMYGTGKVDVRVLKDILGHAQLNTTQIYTHVSDENMKKAMSENPLNQNE